MRAFECVIFSWALLCHARNSLSGDSPNIYINEWVLEAHGSSRMTADGVLGSDWTTKFDQADFHYPMFSVPNGEGPTLAAGVNHRASDNHIHIPILGGTPFSGGFRSPAAGAERSWSPAFVWEIDGNSGKTIRVYDLSTHADCFNSVLRYTSDGYPLIALYKWKNNASTTPIAILDYLSENIEGLYYNAGIEPLHLKISNTMPKQLLWSGLNANAAVSIKDHTVDGQSYAFTFDMSSVYFGADGKVVYSFGFFNHYHEICRYNLPLTQHPDMVYCIQGCLPRPWRVVSDTMGNVFADCSYFLYSFFNNGTIAWYKPSPNATFLTLTDTEDVLILGDGHVISGVDVVTGNYKWNLTASDFGGSIPVSAQPWAPRYPIPLPNGNIAVLVVNDGVYSISLVDSRAGKIVKGGVTFDFAPQMLTADDSYNVYAFGTVDGYLTVQRKALRGTE